MSYKITNPSLTVVLPVHNGMPFLEAALHSILKQTYTNFRVLAINDGSTDGSGEYLDGVRDERLSVLHQSCRGLGAVLNRGIDLCNTTFLARMDADDISLATRFEEQVAVLVRNPTLIAVGSPLDFLVHGTQQRGLIYPTEHGAIMADLLRGQSSLSHPTLLMRTEAARATRYRIAGAGEDLDFCLRLGEYGKIANLPTAHYLYRLHEASVSMTKQGEIERGYSYARLTATQRKAGQPEISFTDFAERWQRRSLFRRVRTRLVAVSFARYRRARLAWARHAYMRSAIDLSISLALQPFSAGRLLFRKLSVRPSTRTLGSVAPSD